MALNLITICIIAFAAVFVLLLLLAVAMHLITILFPERTAEADGAVVAAISSTVASLWPGARVTRIEEDS
jgi:hypothetical protein